MIVGSCVYIEDSDSDLAYREHAVYSKTGAKRPLKNRQNKDLNNNW